MAMWHLLAISGIILLMQAPEAKSTLSWPFTNVAFAPVNLTNIPEESEHTINVKTCINTTNMKELPNYVNITVSLTDSKTAQLLGGDSSIRELQRVESSGIVKAFCKGNDAHYAGNVTVKATRLGYNTLLARFSFFPSPEVLERELSITIVRASRVVDRVFNILLVIFVVLNQIGFGSKFDIEVASEIIKRPIPFVIWFFCQFGIMPTLAFGIGKALQLPPALAFGLLAVGCSPGGGQSNVWTLLLGGDITLSVCLTCVSSFLALGLMPLWLLTLGKTIFQDQINIPFDLIFLSLIMVVIPLSLGLLIRRKAPKIAYYLEKTVKPMAVAFILFLLTLGVYSNWYAMKFMVENYRILVSGLLLPWVGTFISGLVALIARQPRNRAITIAIETAYQNAAIAIVVLRSSLQQPEADLTIVMPVTCVIFTPIPFIFGIILKLIIGCFCGKKEEEDQAEQEKSSPEIKGIEQINAAVEKEEAIESSKF